jgi:hypothetical protein
MAFRGPLLDCRFLVGALLSGFTLGSPIDSMGVDQLGLTARDSERASRDGLSCDFGVERFARSELAFGLGPQLGVSTPAPVSHLHQITGAERALFEPRLLCVRKLRDALLSAVSREFGPCFICASTQSARGALTDLGGLPIHALMAEPLQRFERIAVTHPGSVAKPSAFERASTSIGYYWLYSPSAERACHS